MINFKIDWGVFQTGDILITTSPAIISNLIRSGEAWEEEFIHKHNPIEGIIESVKAWSNSRIPSHCLFVYDETGKGAEMTYPKARYCNIKEYTLDTEKEYLIQAFRCPWLDDKHNPESALYLRNNLKKWIDDFISGNVSYGIDTLLSFISPMIPQNKNHPTCSIFVALGLIKAVWTEGYDIRFPDDWFSVGPDNTPSAGLVSPNDFMHHFNELGWGIKYLTID